MKHTHLDTYAGGWNVHILVDADGHLNIFVLNKHCDTVHQVDADMGDGEREALGMRFTTNKIEADYQATLNQ